MPTEKEPELSYGQKVLVKFLTLFIVVAELCLAIFFAKFSYILFGDSWQILLFYAFAFFALFVKIMQTFHEWKSRVFKSVEGFVLRLLGWGKVEEKAE